MHMKEARISAVAFQEGDIWIVQGIEYDILARAKDPADLPDAFVRAVIKNLCVSDHLTGEPFKGIGPAPQKFREMFERARARVASVDDPAPIGGKYKPEVDIRLLAHA
jgi:hypothetical protein